MGGQPGSRVLRLRAGSKMGVGVEADRVVVERRERPGYTLDELLAKKAREWIAREPAGAALI
jgi:hypothetical protein